MQRQRKRPRRGPWHEARGQSDEGAAAPGLEIVHTFRAVLGGEALEGTWFNRTQEHNARNRGEKVSPRQFATTEVLELSPLPCWRHLTPEQYRERIAALVEEIAEEARSRRRKAGIQPL